MAGIHGVLNTVSVEIHHIYHTGAYQCVAAVAVLLGEHCCLFSSNLFPQCGRVQNRFKRPLRSRVCIVSTEKEHNFRCSLGSNSAAGIGPSHATAPLTASLARYVAADVQISACSYPWMPLHAS
jgi:hypothetical protein